ncbi:MAG: hypothetical protein M1829_002488 [Trizodia sp. TS-e1964]|nr:MAG: hypothetical protein M1829_002488 [Trizodia sp. TS-e1964]
MYVVKEYLCIQQLSTNLIPSDRFLLRRSPFGAYGLTQLAPLVNPRSSKTLAIPILRAIRLSQQKRLYSDQLTNQHDTDLENLGSSESSISDYESLTQSSNKSPFSSSSRGSGYLASSSEGVESSPEGYRFASSVPQTAKTEPFKRPYIEPAPSPCLFIGNLLFEVNEEHIREAFSAFGEISHVKIIYDQRGLSKGHGYITFNSIESASKAREAFADQPFQGRKMVISYALHNATRTSIPRIPNPPTRTLYVGNVPFNLTDNDLNNILADLSGVKDVRVAMDRRTGQPRGFFHIEFVDMESARIAKEQLSNREIFGRTVRLDFSRDVRDRSQGATLPHDG